MAEGDARSPGPGGFLAPNLPSPAPTTSSNQSTSGLPHPRAHSLRPGSVKEDKIRQYIEGRILHISRRYVKKFGIAEEGDDVVGYKTMGELCRDLQAVIDVLWLSGTPSLQVPYLLRIANEFTTWLTSFAPSPTATFAILRKLDHCFASLLSGQDMETDESLPGFENGMRGGMNQTDMVRCKSTVAETRVVIVKVMSSGEPEDEDDYVDETGQESAAESNAVNSSWGEDDDETTYMDVARVYEHTLVKLGDVLPEESIIEDT